MRAGPENRLTLIRRHYQACENDDRPAMEQLLYPDFLFTSPDDDRSDRAHASNVAGLPAKASQPFTLLDVCAGTQAVLIRYQASGSNGLGFVNVEHFEFTGDGIAHTDLFFGRTQ